MDKLSVRWALLLIGLVFFLLVMAFACRWKYQMPADRLEAAADSIHRSRGKMERAVSSAFEGLSQNLEVTVKGATELADEHKKMLLDNVVAQDKSLTKAREDALRALAEAQSAMEDYARTVSRQGQEARP